MNFAALKQELADRGFAHLSDARRGQYVNWARAALDDLDLWPYRERSATGTPPLAIADLGVVEMVINMTLTTPLQPVAWQTLVDNYHDLAQDGTPLYYYLAQPDGGSPKVATYPFGSSSTIGVQYWRVTPELAADDDTPLAETRFHGLIVDMAAEQAYRDVDNHDAADRLQARIKERQGDMRFALLVRQVQAADRMIEPVGDDN